MAVQLKKQKGLNFYPLVTLYSLSIAHRPQFLFPSSRPTTPVKHLHTHTLLVDTPSKRIGALYSPAADGLSPINLTPSKRLPHNKTQAPRLRNFDIEFNDNNNNNENGSVDHISESGSEDSHQDDMSPTLSRREGNERIERFKRLGATQEQLREILLSTEFDDEEKERILTKYALLFVDRSM